jgi:ribonuclease Y
LEDKKKNIEEKFEEIDKKKDEWLEKLEEISHLTSDEAKDLLLKTIEGEVKEEAQRLIKEVKEAVKEESDRLARHHIVTAMQRCAADHASEITVTSVSLPNDEMKGRVIGREGRNIRTLERLTGVTITVDDTPESITLSSFNPVRREVARISLEKLIKDGRIHPARIEEEVKKAKINVAREIIKSGEEAAFEAGVAGLSREVIKLMGKLKYRTSYGQNVLQHSVEVAKLSALLAGELGANADIARKAGFLHDIGKAVDQEMGGGHAIVTGEVLKRLGLSEEVVYAAKSHHEDFPLQTTEDYIVQIADAISGARPGARRDSHEQFIQRIKEIEQVANSFNGVDSSYAIHAGREVRVLVDPEEVDDLSNMRLCRDIAMKIQDTLKYPGQIKVVTLRETRAEEVAK